MQNGTPIDQSSNETNPTPLRFPLFPTPNSAWDRSYARSMLPCAMKSFVSLLTALAHRSGQGRNHRLLIRFLLLLLFFFVLYSVLFHLLMLWEGTEHSWITGFYWTLTVMTTLGFGDITFAGDLGRFFSVVVLLTGVLFLLVILPFTFIQFFYAPWLEAQNQARAPRSVPERTSGHVILTHFDAVAVNLIGKLDHHGIPSVLLIPDLARALELHDQGYRVMRGELDDPETYRRMRAGQAALAVVLNGDLASTNIASTIREVTERVPIVTDAEVDDSLDILQLAGSTHVFQFTRVTRQGAGRQGARKQPRGQRNRAFRPAFDRRGPGHGHTAPRPDACGESTTGAHRGHGRRDQGQRSLRDAFAAAHSRGTLDPGPGRDSGPARDL